LKNISSQSFKNKVKNKENCHMIRDFDDEDSYDKEDDDEIDEGFLF
jgi:hypothetical protein